MTMPSERRWDLCLAADFHWSHEFDVCGKLAALKYAGVV